MLKVTSLQKTRLNFSNTYAVSARTFNIISNEMADDFLPHEVDSNTVLWLSRKGVFGELEAIYPTVVGHEPCSFARKVESKVGLPLLTLDPSQFDVSVQLNKTSYTIWLTQERITDLEITSNLVTFLVSGNELVGCRAEEYTELNL